MRNNGEVRAPYHLVAKWLDDIGLDLLSVRAEEAEAIFRRIGITFAVYGEGGDPERLIPFDLIPRVLGASEWDRLAEAIKQRAKALNAFLYDIYHRREILRAGIIPERLVIENSAYLPEMVGFDPPGRVYSHVVGVDLVRTGEAAFSVLEDNCRTPSGVSYMLENREITMRMFPELFGDGKVRSVDTYPHDLRRTLEEVAPPACTNSRPAIAVLTPGPFNSAYYEHSFLADLMGAELVEARDLEVHEGRVWRRTTRGLDVIDVIYRRIDDAFLDPLIFNKESVLGVPGLMNAYLSGGVTICSAPGAGVADDKAIYTYVPDMIDFYLGEKPLIPNVETYKLSNPDDLAYTLDHLDSLVVKEVAGSGGYGMLIGPRSTASERKLYAQRIEKDPAAFIAQPTLDLSTAPTLIGGEIKPRHVDLRPFCLVGKNVRLTPGGLTRVALREGSLVVNSSQGGGVKDTWVLAKDPS